MIAALWQDLPMECDVAEQKGIKGDCRAFARARIGGISRAEL